ncbi:hypothetical protein DFH09DRAFT_1089258 [Mycena vulgaris]|nr:hypothetical protein DFH09DRAFT_1089258 [Mycena vulgaris]
MAPVLELSVPSEDSELLGAETHLIPNNYKQIRRDHPGGHPTPKRLSIDHCKIWHSICHKDISRQIKTFLWKGMHGAHRIGKYWEHIPEYGNRAVGTSSSSANRPGQATVWRLAEELWTKKRGHLLPPPSMGGALGCALATFEQESRKKPSGVNRLYRNHDY